MKRYYIHKAVEIPENKDNEYAKPFRIKKAQEMVVHSRRHHCFELILTGEDERTINYGLLGLNLQREFMSDLGVTKPEELVGREVLAYESGKYIKWISPLSSQKSL